MYVRSVPDTISFALWRQALETIAVYWEPVVRVYGYDIKRDISLIELELPLDILEDIGSRADQLAKSSKGFTMTLLQQASEHIFRICIVMASEDAEAAFKIFAETASAYQEIQIRRPQKVELLSFHGPHFQDRYGIADATFSTLAQSDISIRAAGCTGTSIYLIVEEGKAEQARDILSASFVVPEPKARKDLLRH